MKRSILLTFALSVCTSAFAYDVEPRLDQAVRAALPICSVETKITYDALPFKLPPRFTGAMVKIASARPSCADQFAAVLSQTNGFFLGQPWPIANAEGQTAEEKLRNFTYRNMGELMTATIERTVNEHGLWPVTLHQTTEAGKMPLYGFVDPESRLFFFGNFRRLGSDLGAQRTKAFDKFLLNAPARGAASGRVTVIEFSDFQCPSCRHAMAYVDPIVSKHPEQVRYIRYDLPLSGHPWAFPAALVGRAIHRQNPALFWEYKKTVYDNQDKLNAFTFWDWARAWAEDHDLDLAKYDADLNNTDIRAEILNGAGMAFANDVRATPTYLVNGVVVDPGDDGKALAAYVDKLLAQ